MKSHYQHAPSTAGNESLFRDAVRQTVARLPKGGVVADFGSGAGKESALLAKSLHADRLICIDHDHECLRLAAKQADEVIQADLNEALALKSNSLDVIIANQVIEHIARTDTFMVEIARTLKPGGYAVICTPNLASWHNIAALVLGYQPFSSQVSDKQFIGNPLHPLYRQDIHEEQAHLRVFTHRSLIDLGKLYGLRVVRSVGVGFYPFSGQAAQLLAKTDKRHAAYVLVVFQKHHEEN